MKDNGGVFRKASLDRLSSPEQLDKLLQVTRPRGWIALVALGFLVGSAVLWGSKGASPPGLPARAFFSIAVECSKSQRAREAVSPTLR